MCVGGSDSDNVHINARRIFVNFRIRQLERICAVDEVEIFANIFLKHTPLTEGRREMDGKKELRNKTKKKVKQLLRIRKPEYVFY
jgi:hypothetical protein